MNPNNALSPELRPAVNAIKAAILASQLKAAKSVNCEQLSLYFGIGRYISEHSRNGNWGTGAIAQISDQLQKELPGLRGFGERNLKKMHCFHEEWQPCFKSAAMAADLNNQEGVQLLQLSSNRQPLAADLNVHEFVSVSFSHHLEFLIQGYENPMGVATYKTAEDVRKVLPSEKELRKIMDGEV